SGHVAGATGVGSSDVARRQLTDADETAIVRGEADERKRRRRGTRGSRRTGSSFGGWREAGEAGCDPCRRDGQRGGAGGGAEGGMWLAVSLGVVKKIGFLSFGHWSAAPGSRT